jgi:glyoxylase-like metal-dependent hydrolase (beta-lactamase superfamily II)
MSGTEASLPDASLETVLDASTRRASWRLGDREFVLQESSGHTDSDLLLIDRRSGVAFAGGLVFANRIPTTPHARVDRWLASLDRLEALLAAERVHTLVPSHGPVRADLSGIAQTRNYLQWLDHQFSAWARQGWEMTDVLHAPVPQPFRSWAAFETEYVRNVAHLYPRYENQMLPASKPR